MLKQVNGEYDMKIVIMRLILGAFLFTILITSGAKSVWAVTPLVLYDNFNAKLINPDRWFGSTYGILLETVREITSNHLNLSGRSYGITDENTGLTRSAVTLSFPNLNIFTIQSTIQVKDYELVGCGDNDTTSRVRARIVGSFFNIANQKPNSAENDVRAQVRLQRKAESTDAKNVLIVGIDVYRCTDYNCQGDEILGTIDLGTVKVGRRVTLRLEWDQAGKRFIVQRDNEAEVSLYYTVPDTQPPSVKIKRLEAAQTLANCTTQPRPVGFIDAYFDNVYVNQ